MSGETVPSGRGDNGTAHQVGIFLEHHGPVGDAYRPIILVHGAPDRSTAFREVLVHLVGCSVFVYDRRGYGRSAWTAQARNMTDHARDLLDVIGRCNAAPVVVAHSFGSNPTMLAASLRPAAFGAIGLWEPPLPWVAWWPERTKAYNAAVASSDDPAEDIEDIYRRLLGEAAWNGLSPETRAQRRAEGLAFQRDMASELRAPFDFEDVSVPALVGFRTETSDEHAYGARWLAEQLPNAALHSIQGSGHFAPRTHPREFARFVLAAALLATG